MAAFARNTGTHFRYDADDNLWHAKVRIVSWDTSAEKFIDYVEAFATLVELLSWLAALFNGMSAAQTVLGYDGAPIYVSIEAP